jgi:hypothetical protein
MKKLPYMTVKLADGRHSLTPFRHGFNRIGSPIAHRRHQHQRNKPGINPTPRTIRASMTQHTIVITHEHRTQINQQENGFSYCKKLP